VVARSLILLGVLVAGLTWFVPTASVGTNSSNAQLASARPAQGRDPNPGALSNPCISGVEGVRWGSDRDDRTLKDYADGDIICARKGNDIITVRHIGTKIWAGPGHDTVRMKNRKPNELQAGTGRDKARADSLKTDTWYRDLETYQTAGVAPHGTVPTARAETAAWRYPAREPRIHCEIQAGERRLLIDPPPAMRAVNQTARVDWQFVAWSPVLSWWNGERWEFVVQNEWLWDRTYDEGVEAFTGNVWRRYSSGEKWQLWFFANRPGYFRVASYYYHYATGAVPANRVYDWVDQHHGTFADANGQWCAFDR
jgi:hypothetical protein